MTFNVRAVDIRQSLIYDIVLVDGVIVLMIVRETDASGFFNSTWNGVLASIEPLYLAHVRNGRYTSIISGRTIDGTWIEGGLLHIHHDSGHTSIPIGTLYYFTRRQSIQRQLRDNYFNAVRRYVKCLAQTCRDIDTLSHISYTMVLVNTDAGTYAAIVEHGYNLSGMPSMIADVYVIAKREEYEWIDLMTNDYAEHVELVEPDAVKFLGEGDYDVEYKLYETVSWHKLAEPQLPQEARKIRQWLLAKLSR